MKHVIILLSGLFVFSAMGSVNPKGPLNNPELDQKDVCTQNTGGLFADGEHTPLLSSLNTTLNTTTDKTPTPRKTKGNTK